MAEDDAVLMQLATEHTQAGGQAAFTSCMGSCGMLVTLACEASYIIPSVVA
jgi:hypothetical protein